MERRSRSTTRANKQLSSLDIGFVGNTNDSAGYYHSNNSHRHSARYVPGEISIPVPASVALRPGGDSRTLSPDRRNAREAAYKTGSYNQYTMQPRLGLQALSSSQVPPPMPPRSSQSNNIMTSTSTPQSTPVKYEDFAEGLMMTNNSNGVKPTVAPPSSSSSPAKSVMLNNPAMLIFGHNSTLKPIISFDWANLLLYDAQFES